MVRVSKNVHRRIQLLKEQANLIQACKQNNRKLDKTVYIDFYKSLKYCKELCKKELLNSDINNLL